MAEKYESAKIQGVYESIQFEKPEFRNFKNMQDNIERAAQDMKADKYDLIHVREIVGHVSDWPEFYKALFRLLRKGGILIHRELTLTSKTDKPIPGWEAFDQRHGEWLDKRGGKRDSTSMVDDMSHAGFQNVTNDVHEIPGAPFLGIVDCRLALVATFLKWNEKQFNLQRIMMKKEASANRKTTLFEW